MSGFIGSGFRVQRYQFGMRNAEFGKKQKNRKIKELRFRVQGSGFWVHRLRVQVSPKQMPDAGRSEAEIPP